MCTSDTVDLDDQIIDLEFSRKGLAEWGANWGNIRQMHSVNLPPAGKAIAVDTTRPEGVFLTARIVEPGAVKLVNEGVYSAFSVGISKPRIIRDRVAKQGRVTDGVFSEVSVVDFPALPTATFTIAKRSKKEVNELNKLISIGTIQKGTPVAEADDKGGQEAEAVEPDAVEAEIVKGEEADVAVKAAAPESAVEGHDDDEVEKSAPDSSDDDSDGDDDSDSSSDDSGSEDDEGSGDDDMNKSVDISYALHRAHDALCPAYSMETVTTAHPAITEKGLSGIIDPDVIRTALSTNAALSTPDPTALLELSKAFGEAQLLKTMDPDVVTEARADLHKAFSDMYPDAHPTPGSVTPGQFQRGFISGGHAPLNSTGANARIPAANSSITASQFSDDGVDAGRAADSPANGSGPASSSLSAVDQIAAVSRDQASSALSALHDRITAIHGEVCPISMSGGKATINNDGGIRPIAASAKPKLTKTEKLEKKLAKAKKSDKKAAKKIAKAAKVEKKETEVEIEVEIDDATVIKAAVVGEKGEVLIDTAVLSELVKNLVLEATEKKFIELDESMTNMQAEIDDFGAEPDPLANPMRGGVIVDRAVTKAASEADHLREAANNGLAEEIAYVTGLTKSGNPELRQRAEQRLAVLQDKITFEVPE